MADPFANLHTKGSEGAFKTPDGEVLWVPLKNRKIAVSEGFQPLSTQQFNREKDLHEAGKRPGAAGALGAARGLTLGLSDVVGGALGFGDETELLKEANPTASTIGEVGGSVGSLFIPGGALGVAGKLGAKGAGALATRAAAKGIAGRAAGGLAKAVLPGASIGAATGIGEGISDVALAQRELSIGQAAQRIADTATRGTVMGGAFGMGGAVARAAGGTAASLVKSGNQLIGRVGRAVFNRPLPGVPVLAEAAKRIAPGNAGGFLSRALNARQRISEKVINGTINLSGRVLPPVGQAAAVATLAGTATEASDFQLASKAALQRGLLAPDSGPEQLLEGVDPSLVKRIKRSSLSEDKIEAINDALTTESDDQVRQAAMIGYRAGGLENGAAQLFADWQVQRRQLLRENLPDGKDQLQRFRFEKVFDAVSEPRNIFARMERNELNNQDVEVLARLYPKIHAQLAEAATAVLADRRATALTPPRRETLELLSGGINIQKRNARIQVIQSSFKSKEEREKQKQGQSKASRPRADFKTPDLSTGTQRTFQRGGD